MKCSDCGYDLKEEDKKFPRCGKEVNASHAEKKPKKNHTVMILAIILSAVSIVLVAIGFQKFSSPKIVMLQSISNFAGNMKEAAEMLESNFMAQLSDQDKVKVDGTLELEVDPSLGLNMDPLTMDFVYAEDSSKKNSTIDLSVLMGENGLFDLDMIMADSKLYFDLKEITETYYYTDFDYVSLFEDVATIDYSKLIDIVKDNFTEQIDQDKIEKSKEEISLGDKEKNTTKLSYRITNKMINDTLSGILEDIKNDKNLLENLAKMSGLTTEEFSASIDEALDGMENIEAETYFYYNVYYYGFNNIVMEELADDSTSIQYYHYDQTKEFVVLSEGQEMFYIQMVENGDKTDIDGNLAGYTFSGSYQEQKNGLVMDLTINIGTDQITLSLVSSREDSAEQFHSTAEINLTGNLQGVDLGEGMTVRCDLVYTYGEDVEIPDLSGARDANAMTEEEMNTIITNIQNHPFLSMVYESLMNSASETDNYDDSIYEDYTNEGLDLLQEYEYSY
ncbi:MAG TPA: hypothetical protein IAB56_03520 [Candidatus Scybalousia intestinigallinarum]|nr:hypothetical protein [Candidatus Scybalousia intestinigallinarum]